MRLDQYVAEHWPDQSRSTWQKLIKQGNVTINGTVAESTKQVVKETDDVQVTELVAPDFTDKTLPILYEDDNVIVINKPVGVLSHSKGALNDEFTVADFFRSRTSYKADTNRPGIIHRLDRDTSGVMIGAKNDETAHLLMKQFQDRKAKKTYVAVVDGVLKDDEALINLPIGRNPKQPSSFRVDSRGKSAETAYTVRATDGVRSLIELRPKTGRTHQLRVHMAYLNAPIRGDRVYGKSADRLFLHANKLEITIPVGQREVFEAPLPKSFEAELSQ